MGDDSNPLTGATATDLFAGGGGASQGMKEAGIVSAYAINHHEPAIRAHQRNHPQAMHLCTDVTHLDPKRLKRTTLLWASASCTHHSNAQGKRRNLGLDLSDNYNPGTLPELYEAEPDRSRATMLDIVRFTETHRYEGVIVENVPAVTGWALYPHWLSMMESLGYSHRIEVVDASRVAMFGPAVPQQRERYIGLFWRGSHAPEHLTLNKTAPAADLVLDADPGRFDWEERLAPATVARINATLERYPDAERMLASYYGASKVGRVTTRPMGTLTTVDRHGLITRTKRGVGYRMITNAEGAAAQGFPSNYDWAGASKKEVTKMIGNAVPTNVARDAAKVLVDAIGRVGA